MASAVGLHTAITSAPLPVRPVGQFIHVFEHAEEIRLLDDQGRDVLAVVGREGFQRRVAALPVVRQFDQLDALVAHDGAGRPAVIGVHRRGHQDAV